MKNKTYFLPAALSLVLGLVMVACLTVKAFVPAVNLPEVTIPNMVLISLVVLLVDDLAVKQPRRCWVCIPVFSFLAFGLLPWAANMVNLVDTWKVALCGAAVFTLCTWLFTSMQARIATGKYPKAAIYVSALGLYLAAQALTGLIL